MHFRYQTLQNLRYRNDRRLSLAACEIEQCRAARDTADRVRDVLNAVREGVSIDEPQSPALAKLLENIERQSVLAAESRLNPCTKLQDLYCDRLKLQELNEAYDQLIFLARFYVPGELCLLAATSVINSICACGEWLYHRFACAPTR
jgi:hypothetical protein